jgi:MFS family permease
VVSVVSRLGLARIVARFGRRTLLVVAMLMGVASLVALPFANQWGAIPVMIALGIALGLPQPLTMAWTTAITPPAVHGAALGLRLTANRVLQVLVPVSVGLVAGPFGLVAIFWSNAAVLAVGVAIVATSRTSDRDGETPE